MNENLAITIYEKDTSIKEYVVTRYKHFFKKTQKCLALHHYTSSGFAAIVCYRASPFDGIYIMKNENVECRKIVKKECV